MTLKGTLSRSPLETQKLGVGLAKYLREGDVIGLIGDLASGKTTFVQGLAKGLKVRYPRDVTSPTFVLVHEYAGRLPLCHIDLYRIEAPEEVDSLGLDELVSKRGVTVVEWAERLPTSFRLTYTVVFESLGRDVRRLTLKKIPP